MVSLTLIVAVESDAHFWIFKVVYFGIESIYKVFPHGFASRHEYIVSYPNNNWMGVVTVAKQFPEESAIYDNWKTVATGFWSITYFPTIYPGFPGVEIDGLLI